MSRQILSVCLIALSFVAVTGCGETEEEQAPLIAMQDFFRNPEQTSYQLSPDGMHLSWLQPWQGRLNVHVRALDGGETTRITSSTARDIFGYMWTNDERLVYIQDSGGDENYHAFAVNLDGSNYLDLTPFEAVQARLVDRLRDDPEHVLGALNQRDARIHDVYKINVNTGEMVMVAENPGNIMGWQTDNAGRIRVATTTDGVNSSLLYRATEEDAFETVVTTNFKETLAPLFFDWDDVQLYVASNIGRDKTAIFKYDPTTGEHGDLIFEHDKVDVTNLMRSRHRKVITGVAYTVDKRGYHFFDDDREQLQKRLERELSGVEVAVASMSEDESKVLVRTFSDKSRGAYYYLNRENDKLEKLVDVSPWLDESVMADQKPIEYTSRDGLTIHGYLTLPRGIEAKGLPVVVNPHGGPWARDNWGFNPEIQFLANRGYAVLQMNFRGSTGFGKEFWTASFKQWGLKMQDDITDGVNWLIEEGIADPDRMGFTGYSYGGLSTNNVISRTDRFQAAVSIAGIFNYVSAMGQNNPQLFIDSYDQPWAGDLERMWDHSPASRIADAVTPTLIMHGTEDEPVDPRQSIELFSYLQLNGVPSRLVLYPGEGHGINRPSHMIDYETRELDWFDHYLLGDEDAEGAAEAVPVEVTR